MTAGPDTRPEPGDVLQFVYLFAREAAQGRDEGVKERPVVVVGREGRTYRVAAVTTKGRGNPDALLLPDPVADAAGLRRGCGVIVTEVNRFTWLGFDIRPLRDKPGYISGFIPPGFYAKIVREILARDAAVVPRD